MELLASTIDIKQSIKYRFFTAGANPRPTVENIVIAKNDAQTKPSIKESLSKRHNYKEKPSFSRRLVFLYFFLRHF